VAAVAISARSARSALPPPQAALDTAFAPTIANAARPSGRHPEDGLDSGRRILDGRTAASEGMCELHGVTRDALPVHRVYVDPFWMDATASDQRAVRDLREGHRVPHRRERYPPRRTSRERRRRTWWRDRSLRAPPGPSVSTIIISGGVTRKARAGVIRWDRAAT